LHARNDDDDGYNTDLGVVADKNYLFLGTFVDIFVYKAMIAYQFQTFQVREYFLRGTSHQHIKIDSVP